jgi:uncharacterized membrane protein YtjA (UPF0391 family)
LVFFLLYFKAETIKGKRSQFMLRAAIIFFVLGLVGIFLGATGFAGLSIDIGKTLLGVFLVLAIISLVAGAISGRGRRSLP